MTKFTYFEGCDFISYPMGGTLSFAKQNASSMIKIFIGGTLLVFIGGSWLLSNEVLMNRIYGRGQYNTEDSFESLGSGRGGIFISSMEIFNEASIIEKMFGIGQEEQINRIAKKTGMTIGSHNAFLDFLLISGLVGMSLFLFYIRNVFQFIKKSMPSKYKTLAFSLLVAYVIMCLVQGYDWLYANLLLMLSIGILNRYHKQEIIKQT